MVVQELDIIVDTTDSSVFVVPEVSMHALASQISSRTIRIKGRIGNHYVHILIDSGSTHNFIQERVVHQLGLSITPSK